MAAAVAATATGALRRVLLPTTRRRLATSTGQPLISFTGARAGTTEAHQAEVAARRQLRRQKMWVDGLSDMALGVAIFSIVTSPFTVLLYRDLFPRERKPEDCPHQSASTSPARRQTRAS